jgi:hypothetical protein
MTSRLLLPLCFLQVFQEVSHAFHSSPSALGILTFIRGLVQVSARAAPPFMQVYSHDSRVVHATVHPGQYWRGLILETVYQISPAPRQVVYLAFYLYLDSGVQPCNCSDRSMLTITNSILSSKPNYPGL